MTLFSTINSASGCTIPTVNDEVRLYLHGSEGPDVYAALAWWNRRQNQTKFPLLLEAALQHDIRHSAVPPRLHNSGV
ncbi:hypothetical protein K443DRAFT_117759 [Laccaria amethystina LaAM-08-1]|uniref:Unplaced genomic scaffold K443scaffold_1034, whole genome shotgun sequence n=1 Tax=Laccaria amethystina LaAM-08-1 TaxID=1095629 RepID=A0A0C9WYV1_9AGAR|nr:hypothetical protein K443DRAFT_117759 [Laccaria amethystina LaAM-08-1]